MNFESPSRAPASPGGIRTRRRTKADGSAEIREIRPAPRLPPALEARTFRDVLRSLVGHAVTVVNSESYEDAPVGHQIRAGFYPAQLAGLGEDYLVLVGQYVHSPGAARSAPRTEPVRQYVPIAHVKRISILRSERLLHI